MPRLYIVEGLPCSGKSTVSRHIADKLSESGGKVVFVDEGTGNHPADYELHAYLGESSLQSLPGELQAQVRQLGEPKGVGWLVSLASFGGEELDRLLPYKIYDSLPWNVEMPLMLDKWEGFVKQAENGTSYVFNCVLLQNPMCETMMRFDFPEERSFAYVSKIVERIAPLEPTIIYLKNDRIAESVQSAAGERPGWLEAVVAYHTNGAYGRRIGARGFEGYIACLEERQRRELAILGRLPVRSLVLENPQHKWAEARRAIDAFIGKPA